MIVAGIKVDSRSIYPNFGSSNLVNPSFLNKEGKITSLRQFTYADSEKVEKGDKLIHCPEPAVFQVVVLDVQKKEGDRTPKLKVKISEVLNSTNMKKHLGLEFEIELVDLFEEVT